VYSVRLAHKTAVPDEIRAELRLRLHEITTTLANVPADHIVWESMRDSEVRIDVRGWHFFYRVDRKAQRVTVVRALRAES
jgi:hypothetical protein